MLKGTILSTAALLLLFFPQFCSSECPSYGCLLQPRDVSFDEQAQRALQALKRNAGEDALKELASAGDENHATLTMIGYKGGRMEDQINQDRATIVSPFMSDYKLAGVWDGHGHLGEVVSEFATQQTPLRLTEKLLAIENHNDEEAIVSALKSVFIEIDRDVPTGGIGGCTASLILQVKSKLYVANAGDSRTIVATHSQSTQSTNVVFVTREDKPHLEDEKARIYEMGGKVWIPPDVELESSRVIFIDEQTGRQSGLAMSRSIGDWDMTGAIAEPLVEVIDLELLLRTAAERHQAETCSDDAGSSETCTQVTSNDIQVFCVSATDGMMDYKTPEDVADAFAAAFYTADQGLHPFVMAEQLILDSANQWNYESGGEYRDDIAVAAINLGNEFS